MSTYRLIFLGAGFSHLAGLPLGLELFREVQKAVTVRYGPENHVKRDLERFIRYLDECCGRSASPEEVDLEEFLGFLDVEHYLGLKGKDTWSSEGNESQLMIRCAIAQVLHQRSPQHSSDIPSAYRRFARQLDTSDYVFTFNYDTLLERALELEGIPYRLFPDRYAQVGPFGGTLDCSKEELVLLKLHGSIDWFSRNQFDELSRVSALSVPDSQYSHPIFGHDAVVNPEPLTDGPRPPDDTLKPIYRVRNFERLLSKPFWQASPFILAPSSSKLFYAQALREFWWGMQRIGGRHLSLAIIGYSLPRYDDYAKQAIYQVSRNFLLIEPTLTFEDREKTKIRIVDLQRSLAAIDAFRVRFRFLDWCRTEACFDGFSDAAADWILR